MCYLLPTYTTVILSYLRILPVEMLALLPCIAYLLRYSRHAEPFLSCTIAPDEWHIVRSRWCEHKKWQCMMSVRGHG